MCSGSRAGRRRAPVNPSDPVALGLPHRHPFIFVDEVLAIVPGKSAEARKVFPPDEPFFRGTTEFFGVSRVVGRINAHTPLPDLGKKFDLVSAHRVCFHRIARGENGEWIEWTQADWKFFINDVRTRFLKPDGRLLLEFNRRTARSRGTR